MKKYILLYICLFFLTTSILAQNSIPNVISAAGMFQKDGNNNYLISIGEPIITTLSNNTNTLTQGFIQPFSFLLLDAIQITDQENLALNVYPNPATEEIYIDIKDTKESEVSFLLYDQYGRLLRQEENIQIYSGSLKMTFDISSLTSGIYYLKTINPDQRILATVKFSKFVK